MTDLPSCPLWATTAFLPIADDSVATARRWTTDYLTNKARLDGEHLDDVVLVTSEMVTNGIRYGGNGRANIGFQLGVWSKWTLITVDDRDPEVHAPSGDIERGRGLLIVRTLAERFWWRPLRFGKTANAVILRPGVRLTADDRAVLERLEAGE